MCMVASWVRTSSVLTCQSLRGLPSIVFHHVGRGRKVMNISAWLNMLGFISSRWPSFKDQYFEKGVGSTEPACDKTATSAAYERDARLLATRAVFTGKEQCTHLRRL